MTTQAAMDSLSDALSQAELREAISSFSTADLLRLKRAATFIGKVIGMEPDDLVQEAVIRGLEDVRHCRRDMKVAAFLIGAMKSIACSNRRGVEARRVTQLVEEAPDESETLVRQEIKAVTPSMENGLIERQHAEKRIEAIFEMFKDDEDATLWLMARMDTDSLAEAQAAAGFDAKKMNTVGHRVRRKVEREMPRDLRQ